jgi:hypothetical protein
VVAKPDSLATEIELSWGAAPIQSNFLPQMLTSSTQDITIDGKGYSTDRIILATYKPNEQTIGKLRIDLRQRVPSTPGQTITVALHRIGNPIPAAHLSQTEIQEELNEVYGRQANAHFSIVQDWSTSYVNYDLNGDGTLSDQNNAEEYAAIKNAVSHPTADVNVYIVKKIDSIRSGSFWERIHCGRSGSILKPFKALYPHVGNWPYYRYFRGARRCHESGRHLF